MNEKIKSHLLAYCESNNWDADEENIIECLKEAKTIYSEIGPSHRWYDEKFCVVEINGMLIGYDWFHVTGDTSISDMGLEFDINSVCEVEKKQKTIYYYEKL